MFSAPVPNAIGRSAFWHGPLHPITIPTVGVRSSRVRARACVWNAYSTKYFVRVRFLRYYSRVHIVHLLPLILTGVAPMRCPKLLHSFDCFAKYATHTCQGQACWSVKAIRRSPPIRLYIHTPPLFLLLHKPARKRTKSDRYFGKLAIDPPDTTWDCWGTGSGAQVTFIDWAPSPIHPRHHVITTLCRKCLDVDAMQIAAGACAAVCPCRASGS